MPPRPLPRAAVARGILRGRGALGIKCLLGLCAAAALAGSVYGLTQVRTAICPAAGRVLITAEATFRGALDAGHGLSAALADLYNATQALGTALLQAGAPAGVPALEEAGQQLGATSSRLATGAATLDAVLEGLGSAVLGEAGVLHTARAQYLPLAQTGESL